MSVISDQEAISVSALVELINLDIRRILHQLNTGKTPGSGLVELRSPKLCLRTTRSEFPHQYAAAYEKLKEICQDVYVDEIRFIHDFDNSDIFAEDYGYYKITGRNKQ